jgi:non-ribosomal peptide synthetase component F
MVLLAAYCVLLRNRTGATDIIVPTLSSGRSRAEFHATVGSFFNYVALRTELDGCRTFGDVVVRTRATCIEALTHELPFGQVMEEAPTLMSPLAADDLALCAFQVFQPPVVLDHELVGELEYTEIRRRLLSQSTGFDVPDGAVLQMDVQAEGDMIGSLPFNSNLFEASTMSGLVEEFRQVLRSSLSAPDALL